MIRFIENYEKKKIDFNGDVQKEYLVLDETIWEKGRAYFTKNRTADPIPVVNRENEIICFAWQDKEARREVRMLWELETCDDAINFRDLHPNCQSVIIHGCNELAWYMKDYLIRQGIMVYAYGKFWKELGVESCLEASSEEHSYVIWAEGAGYQKTGNWKLERLRSASVEFECVNEIYEANIKTGKIADADGGCQELLARLRNGKEIVIRGTGTKAQDAYEWLTENDIQICAFQSGKADETRRSLFGIPILKREEVINRFTQAVILECGSKHSAWGFGEVDAYAYEGYQRNVSYLLLRDYLDVPENNLSHILNGKNLVLAGDIRLSNRLYRWFKQNNTGAEKIEYWDILGENEAEIKKFQIPITDGKGISDHTYFLLVLPEYSYKGYLTKDTVEKKEQIIKSFITRGIFDYTDYFSDLMKCIHLERDIAKYGKKELQPAGILLGAIPPFSGNLLFRQTFDGHPQILIMDQEDSSVGTFIGIDLYSICVRLAEEQSDTILADFWMLYQREVGLEVCKRDFPDKNAFIQKMEELLRLGDHFTSQELFVMFHLAINKMYGQETPNLNNMVIYWEPHCLERKYVRELAYWLGSSDVKGFTISTVRNQYIRAGSSVRLLPEADWMTFANSLFGGWDIGTGKNYAYWEQRTIKFEEMKCHPRQILAELCEWLGIEYSDTMLETTFHGEKAFYDGDITGFDVRPAYNLYEEYFTVFDRMRIALAASIYQKQHGYPYVCSLQFSRRELQEMFLKEFRWEKLPGAVVNRSENNFRIVLNRIKYLLWLARFSEIMEIEITEEY